MNLEELVLQPCPFCGGGATAYKDNFGKYLVMCDECGAMIGVSLEIGKVLVNGWTAIYETPEEAVNAWNKGTEVEKGEKK